MYFLQGIAIGIWLICMYIIWIDTKTWLDFLFYFGLSNLFGIIVGIPSGLATGGEIKRHRAERARKDRVREICGKKK